MMNTDFKGREFEARAKHYLEAQGLRSLWTRFRTRWTDIDLIVEEGNCVVFVEVRYRSRRDAALETIDLWKANRMRSAARYFLDCHYDGPATEVRFDVVIGSAQGEIEWFHDVL